jgi:hypothetical protein
MAPATVLISGAGIAGPALAVPSHLTTLSAVRPDGRRTYEVALRPMHEMRGDRDIEIMRDDLVRTLHSAVADDVEVSFGGRTPRPGRHPCTWRRCRSRCRENPRDPR